MNRGKSLFGVVAILVALLTISVRPVHADAPATDFNLQVSPSPLVATVLPGVKSTQQLQIRNGGNGPENLKIEPRSFTFDSKTGKVNLQDTISPTIASWISFSAPKFSVASGDTFTENVVLNVPKDAGFSYSFALLISRQTNAKPTLGNRAINGSLAVFSLININRPGATSMLKIDSFSASKKVYEYLPASLSVRFNNTGNTIVQPSGNIFVQRNSNSTEPLASLTVNGSQGYILPGTQRTITAKWSDGFPAYKTVENPDGSTTQKLVWNWANLSKLRIGRYTAHLVAVYSQAGRDIPIEGTVSFWVIPWKILSALLFISILILFAVFMLVRTIVRGIRRKRTKRQAKKADKAAAGKPTDPES